MSSDLISDAWLPTGKLGRGLGPLPHTMPLSLTGQQALGKYAREKERGDQSSQADGGNCSHAEAERRLLSLSSV